MNQRLWRNVSRSLILTFLVVGFIVGEAFAAPPSVGRMYISGTVAGANPPAAGIGGMKDGIAIRVYYNYNANPLPQGATTFQWYTYPNNFNAAGDFTGRVAIPGATSATFTLTAAQVGLHISVEVRPRDTGGTFGTAREFRPWSAAKSNAVLASPRSCLKAGGGAVGPANNLDTSTPLCSPRMTTWTVDFTGIDHNPANPPRVVIDWGDATGTPFLTPFLSNPLVTLNDTLDIANMANQKWRVVQPHTYSYPTTGGTSAASTVPNNVCTYTLSAAYAVGVISCVGSGVQNQPFTVWDKEDNASLGVHDINKDPASAGVEVGEITDICEKDQSAIRIRDASDFNCSLAAPRVETTNPNTQAHWVQWVYGTANNVTTGPGVTEKIIINGVSYNSTDLPVYGRVTYQGPPGGPVTAPLPAITDNIQMPTTGVAGQTFVVTMRSWNACNPLDLITTDNNGFNPLQAACPPCNFFDITRTASGTGLNQPGLAPQFPTVPGPAILANQPPVNRIYTIRIIGKPALPVAVNKEFCAATSLDPSGNACPPSAANQLISWEITTGASTAVNWYFGGPPGGGGVARSNLYGANCRYFRPASLTTGAAQNAMRTAMSAGTPGVYSMWATYTVVNGCVSDPIEVQMIIRPALTAPAAPLGANQVCNGTLNEIYMQGGAAPTMTIAASTISNPAAVNFLTQYVWSTSAGDVTVDPPPTTQNVTVDFNIVAQPNPSANRDIRTLLQYTTGPNCPTANTALTVAVFGTSNGGTISGSPTICVGASTGIMTLAGHRGAVLQWERSFDPPGPPPPGAFIAIAGTAGQITFSEVPPNGAGVYKYRALVQNQNAGGPCASVTTIVANQNTVTVNPVPPKPTIAPPAPAAICFGGSIMLTSSDVGGLAASYIWRRNGVATGAVGASVTLTTVAQSGNYTVEVVGIAPSNCTSPPSDPTTVTINPLPTAPNPTGGGAVCSGNPAPDIVWTGLTGTPPFNITYTIAGVPTGPVVEPTTTFTISGPIAPGAYQMTVLEDANGCFATVLGNSRSVTIGGAAPVLDRAPNLIPAITCDNGASTTDPQLDLSLDPASTAAGTYILTYRINGGGNLTKNFTLDLTNGDPLPIISFSEVALNAVAVHTIRVVSIQSPLGCLLVVGTDLSFTVRALPTISVDPAPAAICALGNTTFSVTAAGTNLTYQWEEKVGAGAFAPLANGGVYSDVTTPTLTLTGAPVAMNSNQYRVIVTGYNPPSLPPFCPVTSAAATLTVNAYATITTHPADAPQCVGLNRSFSVTAAGPGLVYRWQQDPDGAGALPFADLADGTVAGVTYSGTGTTTLTLSSVTLTLNASQYRVRLTTTGACSLNSNAATLTVNPLPIAADPAPVLCDLGFGTVTGVMLPTYHDDITIIPGSVDRTFQWFSNAARTVAVPDINNVTVSNGTKFYNIVTVTSTGCVNNGEITFTVRPLPAKAPQTVQICEDAPPGTLAATGINLQNFELVAAGGSLVNRDIEWYEDITLLTLIPAGAAIGAEQNYSINATKTIHAKIIDTASPTVPKCFSQTTLTLDYQARPNDNQITDGIGQVLGATYIVCASSNLVLLQINPGLNPGSTYTWNVPPVSYPNEFELLTGTTGFFIILRLQNSLPPQTWNAGTTYASGNIVTDGVRRYQSLIGGNIGNMPAPGGTPQWSDVSPASLYTTGLPISVKETLGTALCDGNTINTKIIVEGSPPKPIITGPSSVCSGANGLVYSVSNPVAGSYSWTLPPGATITSLPVTASSITVQMSTFSGNITVTHASGTGCTSPAADPFPVTVVARPTILSPNSRTICSGEDLSVAHTLSSSIIGTTYNWDVINVTGFVTGAILGDFATGVLAINQTLTNTSGVTASVTYRVIPIGPGPDNCPGTPQNLTITINPQPVILAGQNKTICSGSPTNFKILLTPAGLPGTTTFSWPMPMMSDLSAQGTARAGVLQSDPIHIADIFVNTTALPITATFTITPVSGSGCTGADETVIITIDPAPVGADIARAAQCSNAGFSVSANNITNGVPGSTFTWVRNALPLGLTQVTGGTGTGAIAETLRNLTGGQLDATYVVTPTSGAGCPGATYVVTVPINPEPVGAAITRPALCSDVAFSVSADNITNGVAGSTFTWARNSLPAGLTQVVAGTGVGPIAETLRNQTSGQLSATYVVTPTSGAGCQGATYIVTVPINPEPLGAAITRAAQCSNVGFSVSADNITNGVAGVTFTWVRNALPAGLTQVAAGSGTGPIAETLQNLTAGQLSATYVVTPTSGAGCVGGTYVVTVPVNPEPIGADITRAAQCSNVAFNLSADNITNGVIGSTFTWVRNALPVGLTQVIAGTGSGAIAETLRNITGGQLSAAYVVTPTSGAGCGGATYVVTVPVNPEPVGAAITRAPQCSNIAFSVSADNITNGVAGVTFTWVRNPLPVGLTPVSAGTGIGPVAETLRNITGGQLSATYVVTPTSGAGCVGTTYVVTVPVNPEPVGAAVTRAVQCSNVAFSVSADNITNGVVGSTFTWVRNALPPGLTQIIAGMGIGPIAETLGNITGGQLSATYTVTPTSGAGCVGVTYVVTVPVNPEPVGANITRAAQCSNAGFSLSADNITNGVAGVTFTWVRNALPVGLTQVTAGTGTGQIAETLRNLTGGQLSATYIVTPTSGASCLGATYEVTVPINPEPVGAAITRAAQCSNVAYSLSADNITNGVAGVTFTWVRNALPIGLTPVTAGSGVGPIAETLRNLTGGQLSATYVVTPTSGVGCLGATYVVTVPVNPEPVGAAITRAAQCSDVAFSLSADNITNGVVGSTFTWVRNALLPGLTQVVAGTGVGPIAETLRNLTGGQLSATYIVTPTSGAGCLGATYVVTVPVNPEPVGAAVTRAAQCSNVAFSLSADNITNGVAGVTFTWVRDPLPPGLTQVTGGSGVGPIAETLSNLTSSQLSASYTVTPTSGAGCLGVTYVVTVPINPQPVGAVITRAAQCSNVGFSLSADNITNGVAGSTFTWVRNPLPVGLTQVVAGTGVGAIAETLRNLTSGQLSADYTVTPTSGVGCVGVTYVVTVPVNPEPVGAAITRAAHCSNVAFSVSADNITNGVAGVTFTWTRNALPVGLTQVAAGTGVGPIAETLRNLTSGQLSAAYTVTPTSGVGCVGATYVVTVPINPEPVGADVTRVAQCSNVAFSLSANNITNGVGGVTFTWVRNALPLGLTQIVAGTGVGSIAETLENLTGGQLSATYVVTPSSGAGCVGATYVVTVPVNPQPIGAAISRAAHCSNAAFSVSADNITNGVVGNTFTWVRNALPAGLTQVTAGSGSGAIAETLRNLTGGQLSATYVVTPTSGAGCTGATYVVTVPVNPEPVAQALSTIERCSGQNINFNIQDIIDNVVPFVGGNSVTSKFSYTVVADFPLDVSPAVFPGTFDRVVATNAPINQTFSNLSNHDVKLTFSITPISDPQNCAGTVFVLEVIYHPEPVGSNFSDPVCSTALNHNIQSQITNPAPGLPSVFTYTVSSDNGGVPAGPDRVVKSNAPITDVYTNGTGSPANITYTITPFNAANPTCGGTPFTYIVNISPNPTGVSGVDPARCSDELFSVDPQNYIVPAVASTFTWTATYDAPLAGPLGGMGLITGSLHNETNGQLFAHYTVTPTAGTCTGATFTIDLPINPEPVMLPTLSAPPPLCSTNAVSSNPINVILRTNGPSQAADSYIISLKSQDAGLVGAATTGTFPANSPIAGESDAIAMDTYRNVTSAQLKVVYTVIPVSAAPANCQGDPFDITVSINPEPVLDDPGFPAVCSSNTSVNNPVNIILGTNGISVNAAGYQLQNVQYSDGGPFSAIPPAGVTPNPGNATIMGPFGSNNLVRNDRYNNTTAGPVTVRYTIQGRSSTLCLSEPLDYDVAIDPEPTLSPAAPVFTCSGIPVAPPLTLAPAAGSPAITSYELQQINIPAGVAPNGGNAGLGVYPTGNFLQADFFFNTLDINRDVVYTIVPISGTCRGVAQTVTVTIRPAPAMFANLNAKACNETASGIVLLDNSIGNPMATAPFSAAAATFDITSITLAPGIAAFGGTNTAPRVTANPNEISGDQFTNNTNNPLTVTYRVVPISGLGCKGPEKIITLTVEPQIIANDPPDDLVCSSVGGVTNTNLILTSPSNPSSGLVTFNYTAVSSMIGPTAQIGGFSSGLGNLPQGYAITDALVNTSNIPGTVTYTITPIANSGGGAGCNVVGSSVAQQTVVITVEPKPKVVTTFSPVPVCEGDPTSVQLTTPTTPSAGTIQFNVIATPNGGMTLTSALKTNYLPAEFITDVWNNPTGDPQTVQYTITPSVSGGLGCPGDPTDIFVTINPRPQLQPAAQADICSGTAINIPLNQVAPPVATGVITWTVSAPGVSGAVGGAGNAIAQTLFNNTSAPVLVTYTVTPKAGLCNGTPLVISFNVNPNPTITTLPSQITICEGTSPNVALTSAVAGTTFAWTVTDLNSPPMGLALNGSGPIINQVIPNTTGSQAAFLYEVTPTGPTGCVGPPKFMTVNVISIIPDVVPDKSVICSGERVQFFNQTLGFGPGGHRWFYRVQGTTAEIEVKTSAVVNYQFTNTTATNPLIYEVVYQASNTGSGFSCTKAPVVVPITVYRNVVADWDPGVIPSLKGGSSIVNFTNTSTPVDPQFRYEWDFGDKATPATFTGATPPPINFSQQGPHVITLKAINIAGEEPAGPGCMDIESRTIVIPVDPLVADFVLDPTAACFPSTVKVIENLATGNVMEWEVIDSNGKLVTTSNLNTPEFLIRTPGLYTVNLTTSDSFLPGLVASSQQTFEIYDKPIASFQARPSTVFVPDTEMNTFNFSTGANFYEWDFGDGETSDEREAKHIYKIEGVYDVVLVAGFEHDDGIVCTDSATQKISAKQGGQTKVPNAFTPNPAGPSGGFNGGGSGSGGAGSFNDVFLPIVKGVEEFNMQIFDRWGNLIFESNNSNQGWDGYDKNGRILPSGVYIYKLTLRLSDGQRTTQIGDITMIR